MVKEEIRIKILNASKGVFSRQGYRDTTVEDILKQANIARATFYKYFPNKRQVFSDVIHELLKALYDNTSNYMLEEIDNPTQVAERICKSLGFYYQSFLDNLDLLQVYFREAFALDPGLYAIWNDFDNRLMSLFTDVLKTGIKNGVFKPIDVELISRAIFMIFVHVPYDYIAGYGRADLDIESIAIELVNFAMEGLIAKPRKLDK